MAAYRSMWRGAISFGPVVIPAGMVKATGDSEGVSFNQLCPEHPDSPVRQPKVCANFGHPVSKPLKGYSVGKDSWVVIDESDLENVPLPTAHVIHIEEFIDGADIGPIYPDGGYFLVPDDVAVPAYTILCAAMAESGKVGIGKYALREREHFCSLSAYDGVILLTPLHWPSELRDVAGLGVPVMDVKPAELKMGVALIEAMAAEWQPEKYHDESAAAIRTIVDAKVAGGPVPTAPPAPKAAADDLMAVLARAVEEAKAKKAPAEKPAPKRKGKAA